MYILIHILSAVPWLMLVAITKVKEGHWCSIIRIWFTVICQFAVIWHSWISSHQGTSLQFAVVWGILMWKNSCSEDIWYINVSILTSSFLEKVHKYSSNTIFLLRLKDRSVTINAVNVIKSVILEAPQLQSMKR